MNPIATPETPRATLLATPRGPQFPSSPHEIGPLHMYLMQLVNEPFLFARMSYGDELTLHFGDVLEAKSRKLKDRRHGSHILSFRGSPWIFKAGFHPIMHTSWGEFVRLAEQPEMRALTRDDIEKNQFIEPGTRVIHASPYAWKKAASTGVQIQLSDGTTFASIPTPATDEEDPDEVACWELLSPFGLLKVGPGVKWEFILTKEAKAS
jgi:hypothetical protein